MLYVIGKSRRGIVKIGTAANPVQRLRELQCGNPDELQLLLALPGGMAEERTLHRVFSARRTRGEWFDFTDTDAVVAVATADLAPPLTPKAPTVETTSLASTLVTIFAGRDRVSTAEIMERLVDLGWNFNSLNGGGKQVARELRRAYGIPEPKVIRFGDTGVRRGYYWSDVVACIP